MTSPRRWMDRAALGVAAAMGWLASSCAPSGFAGQSSLNSVRILASSADQPYAQPGATVNVQILAYDGRPVAERTPDMNLSWLAGCKDPANDAYYACAPKTLFLLQPGPTGAVDAGTCAGLDPDAGVLAPVVGSAQFTVPPDIVTAHMTASGQTPYGLALAFNMACAGDAGPIPIDPQNINPQQIPYGCYGPSGALQGPDDYVLGYARVYAYAADAGPDGGPIANANPDIAGVDTPSDPLPCFSGSSPSFVTAPLKAPLCVPGGKSCPSIKIGPIVPPSSQELNPLSGQREIVWVDFYSTFGGFSPSTRLLYDPTAGSVGPLSKTDVDFTPPVVNPGDPTSGYIFMVVHDDRGGAAWVTTPVQLTVAP